MKRILSTLLALLIGLSAMTCTAAKTVRLTVGNPSTIQRHEVVGVSLAEVCRLLSVELTDSLVVENALGQEVPSQVSHDGWLLVEVGVQSLSEAVFTVRPGHPVCYATSVQGKLYPGRLDDITWENDRGIYRVYGPALQRTGERSYGIDVWVKNTPELVIDKRYKMHGRGVAQRDSLKRIGKPKEANDIYLATSFHHDHGEGMDCYGVGASLGCGTPAFLHDGQLQFPYCYQSYRFLDNGPLRFTVELTYGTSAEGVTEHRRISLDKGSHFNRCTVWYDGIDQPTTFATGVVLHDNRSPVLGPNYVAYADPTENPSAFQSQIYVATLFPDGISQTTTACGHALGLLHGYRGEPFTYWFGSAWSLYDVPTEAHWQLLIKEFIEGCGSPLVTMLQ